MTASSRMFRAAFSAGPKSARRREFRARTGATSTRIRYAPGHSGESSSRQIYHFLVINLLFPMVSLGGHSPSESRRPSSVSLQTSQSGLVGFANQGSAQPWSMQLRMVRVLTL